MKFVEILLIAFAFYNIIVFAFYAIDKYKAIHHLWRIPERVLILLAVFGGGIGAFLGGQICHHKTRKSYFWISWIVGLIVDVVILYFLLK
ncbi:DUF1294 domain-containing protein [Lactococcus fujiensis]|uniref:DUF1294 domain-containing protein n=1 Tax=Lactococcus fujiensis JCM 16395 TaxID=1291764 RepID=A0A2A5RPJ6_9LACT|nr:DUF1294 domain-containing protein [Lactococcus fujiensis]PCS01354.1 hypothetical protein RT41_GL000118 [Lactococcus fujiensis JCM 16395]